MHNNGMNYVWPTTYDWMDRLISLMRPAIAVSTEYIINLRVHAFLLCLVMAFTVADTNKSRTIDDLMFWNLHRECIENAQQVNIGTFIHGFCCQLHLFGVTLLVFPLNSFLFHAKRFHDGLLTMSTTGKQQRAQSQHTIAFEYSWSLIAIASEWFLHGEWDARRKC